MLLGPEQAPVGPSNDKLVRVLAVVNAPEKLLIKPPYEAIPKFKAVLPATAFTAEIGVILLVSGKQVAVILILTLLKRPQIN